MHVRRLVARKKVAPSTSTSVLAQRKRAGLTAWHASLVLSAITVGVIVITSAFISQGASPLSASATDHPSPLGPPVSASSPVTYPLVFAPNSPKVCAGGGGELCVNATLSFSGQTAGNSSNNTSAATTIIQGNATIIEHSSTTTVIRSNGAYTALILPGVNKSYPVDVTAFVQDAGTGQNVTTSGGHSILRDLCYVQPNGFTNCYVIGGVPSGHTYKVTLYVTELDYKTLVAPSTTVTVSE